MGVTDGALCEAWKGTDPHHREVGEEGHACCSHIQPLLCGMFGCAYESLTLLRYALLLSLNIPESSRLQMIT
jgi:hypothetical protein